VITTRLRHLLAATAAATVLVVAGCGGSNDQKGAKLPAAAVRSLDRRLEEIQRRYDAATKHYNMGACDDIAADSFPAVKKIIDGLPADVDQDLKDSTTESFANLQQLTDRGCQDVSTTQTETTPTETQTTPPPTQTTPPPTQTTPPQTETTPPETTPRTTPDNGSGGTGGSGDQNPGTNSPQGGGTEAPPGAGQ